MYVKRDKRVKRKTSVVKLVIALFLLVFAANPRLALAAPTVEIPVIISLTGNAAFAGHDDAEVLSIFESYVNATGGIRGVPLHFNVLDDQSSPQIAVQLINTVLAKKPAVVLGPAVVATCNAIEPLIRNGPVAYCFSPSIDPAPGGFMFATATSSNSIMSAELNYARLKGSRRIAAIVTTDAAGQHNESAFRQIFGSGMKDVQLVDVEHVQPASPSVMAQLVRIQAANPEVLFIYATGGDFGTVLRDMNALGLHLPVVTSGANQNSTLLNQYRDVMPKVLLSSGIPFTDIGAPRDVTAAMAAFTDAFKRAHVDPKSLNVFAWDSVSIVVAALRKLGPDVSAAALHDYLNNQRGFAGIDAHFDFRSVPNRGLGTSAVFLLQWNPDRLDWTAVSSGGGKPL